MDVWPISDSAFEAAEIPYQIVFMLGIKKLPIIPTNQKIPAPISPNVDLQY